MRRCFFVLTLALLLLHVNDVAGKMRCTPIYIFGASASFNDSIVYFTDIQIVDSAWVDEKTEFLINRGEYSGQLRNHFNATGHPNRTCIVSYALKEKDILKKYAKMRKQFKGTAKKPTRYEIRELDEDEFKFISITPANIDDEVAEVNKKATKRAEKSKEKKSKGKLQSPGKPADTDSSMPPTMPPRH